MNIPKGTSTKDKAQLACREALECLGDKKLGLAAQLADSGWSDFFEKLDAIEWYVKKWKINVSQHALEKLQIGAAIKESKLNKVWIARRQKCKRRTRRPLTKKCK
jgi:hypothetical protein